MICGFRPYIIRKRIRRTIELIYMKNEFTEQTFAFAYTQELFKKFSIEVSSAVYFSIRRKT